MSGEVRARVVAVLETFSSSSQQKANVFFFNFFNKFWDAERAPCDESVKSIETGEIGNAHFVLNIQSGSGAIAR